MTKPRATAKTTAATKSTPPTTAPTTDARRGLGARGEQIAADALIERGFALVARNWRCPRGELDIVATERAPDFSQGGEIVAWLVAVEVRTRRGTRFGTALQSFTAAQAGQAARSRESLRARDGLARPLAHRRRCRADGRGGAAAKCGARARRGDGVAA